MTPKKRPDPSLLIEGRPPLRATDGLVEALVPGEVVCLGGEAWDAVAALGDLPQEVRGKEGPFAVNRCEDLTAGPWHGRSIARV